MRGPARAFFLLVLADVSNAASPSLPFSLESEAEEYLIRFTDQGDDAFPLSQAQQAADAPERVNNFESEKLAAHHDVAVCVDTLRQWMIGAGLCVSRSQRPRRVHQPRLRRSCLGELIQIDGCNHAWFEDRGPRCTLLVYVDDATSRLMELRFVASESAFD
jgi:hypothetical protein